MGIRKIVLSITLVCLSCMVNASDFMFRHLEVKDGLSNNQVLDIFKDSEGFMWFATASGLNRYDGSQVKVFRSYETDPSSLPDNYISSIQEDYKGNLWILTGEGYSIYNPESETFNRDVRGWLWEVGIDGEPSLVYIDHNKNMWFYVADKGCFLYMPQSQLLYPLLFEAQQLPAGVITDITECKDGILLVYNNGRLLCLDRTTNKTKWELQDMTKELKVGQNGAFTLFVDSDDDIWIFSPFGLWAYNPEQKKWQSHFTDLVKRQSQNVVHAVAQDNQGRIWVGKELGGIDILDKETGQVKHLQNKPDDERSLQSNTVTALYQAPDEIMWVGTNKKGVSYYNESIFKFGIAHLGDISCIEEDKKGCVWLGTNDEGVICWDMNTGEKFPLAGKTGNNLAANAITCLLQGAGGKVWIGTSGGGLDCYDNGNITHYKNTQNQKNSLVHNHVSALAKDKHGNIWIGTQGGGIQSLNPMTGLVTAYSANSAGLSSDQVASLCIGHDDVLWIGTAQGLSVFDLATQKITKLAGTKSGKAHFSNQSINQVYEDSRGLIWIGTREGLNVYNPKIDELNILGAEQGLSSSIISGIVEDDNKNMWVATARGVTNIVPTVDAKTGHYTFRNYIYDAKDGLQNCEFNQRSIKKLSSGEVLMGGVYGVNFFQPDDIKYNKTLPKVMFTRLLLFNDEVKVGKKYGDRIILDKALNREDRIELNYNQNIFSIQFASDNYILSGKTKYVYRLEGFSDEWLTTGEGKVTYTNLSPGTYTLKVKAINSDGYSSDEESSLKITVSPPFWLSIWAYIIYGVLFIAFVMWIRYLIKRGTRNQPAKHRPEKAASVDTEDNNEPMDEPDEEQQTELVEVNGIFMLRSMADAIAQEEAEGTNEHVDETVEEKTAKPEETNKHQEVMDTHYTHEDKKEEEASETNIIEDIDTVSSMAPQRAMIIQLTEEDDDRIVTHIVPPEELPDVASPAGFRRKMISAASAAKDMVEGKRMAENAGNAESSLTTADERLIDHAMKYVEDNISRSDFSVEELSRHLGMSRVHLYKKLLAITGKTPIEFIRVIRLKRAAQLLCESRQNISEIAFKVGFNNPKYFSKYFKEEYGVLPSVYQEKEGMV